MNIFFDVGAVQMAAQDAATKPESSLLMIILLGFGTVFVGLICLIFIIKLYSLLCTHLLGKGKKEKTAAPAATVLEPVINRQQVIAACAAAIATVMGTDVEAIRIKSFKKVN